MFSCCLSHCSFLGPVQALDFNPFQPGLLATGASDSEIYIWDLNNPTAPLTPGNKSLPPDIISCLSWNRQVQHILASTSPCGRCVVWDLRKNEPIIKVSDNSAMVRSEYIIHCQALNSIVVCTSFKIFCALFNVCTRMRRLSQALQIECKTWIVNMH